MKKVLLAVLILALIAAGYFSYQKWFRPSHEKDKVAAANPDIEYYQCSMHPWVVSDKPGKCPICKMDLTPVYRHHEKAEAGVVHIDPSMVQNIGVKTEVVSKKNLTYTIRATGRVDYD